MRAVRIIRIVCDSSDSIGKAIDKCCIEIANNKDCISLDLLNGANRIEYKSEYDD